MEKNHRWGSPRSRYVPHPQVPPSRQGDHATRWELEGIGGHARKATAARRGSRAGRVAWGRAGRILQPAWAASNAVQCFCQAQVAASPATVVG